MRQAFKTLAAQRSNQNAPYASTSGRASNLTRCLQQVGVDQAQTGLAAENHQGLHATLCLGTNVMRCRMGLVIVILIVAGARASEAAVRITDDPGGLIGKYVYR